MAKQSKRVRKFNASGGVKGRLQKGTITNKGSLKRKGSNRKSNDEDTMPSKEANSYSAELRQNHEESDFVSERNLGDLDMESFFTTFADGVDEGEDMGEQDVEVERDSESDDDGEEEIDDDEIEDAEDEDEDDQESVEEKPKKQSNVNNSSDDDSESSVEDLEALERQMKEEMGKLQEKDPEFHEFLKEEDQELLAYGEGEDDDDEEETDERRDNESHNEENARKDNAASVLSPALLDKMEKGTFRMHGVKALRKFANAFKAACHLADPEEAQEKSRGNAYQFESSEVFDRLMVLALTRVHEEFHYHLLGKGSGIKATNDEEKEDEVAVSPNEPINPQILEKSIRWNDVKPILFTFLKAAIHILSEAKEPDLIVFVLKSLSDFIPYMTPFPRLADAMLKTLTSLWSAPIDSSEDYQVVRLHSFLRVRQLAMTQPFPFIEECLKKLYLAYAQRAKFASTETSALPTLTFMGNCVVELYSLDYHSSYQHAFIYIRQLALHLRTAMNKKTAEAMGAVYCWQFLHCLKLWVAVLTEACQSNNADGASGEEQLLQSLLFPLTQVIFGTARLIPSTRYLPLRLHCVRLLQQLAAAAEVFLPTTSILLDVFDLKELSMPPKKVVKSSVQPLAVTLRLRADSPLRTMEELEMCVSEVFVLLNREVDLYQYSAGFPEFAVRICQRLRKVRTN
jgi:nucleolar complex protein 2